jgi:hypothetical protein
MAAGRLEEMVDDLVGRGRLRAELAEEADEGALTGREGAGDGDGHRPLAGCSL